MAKKNDILKKKIGKKAAIKATAPAADEIKQISAKEAPKKISMKEAPKKITAKEQPKQIVNEELKKITAEEEPKKLTTAQTVAENVETATISEPVAEPKKRGRKPKVKTETEEVVTEPKKRGRKPKVKTEAEEVPAEPKKRGRKPKAKPETEEVAAEPKKRGRKPKVKTEAEAVVTEPKKRGRKPKVSVETAPTEPKKRGRKPKTAVTEPETAPLPYTVEEGIAHMNAMNVYYKFDEYHRILLENETIDKAIDAIIAECQLVDFNRSELELLYADLIRRADMKRSDFAAMKPALDEIMTRETHSFEEASQLYHDTFYYAGKLLEYGERFHYTTTEQLKAWTGVDLIQYYTFYLDMALQVLPGWEDKDVNMYEDFMSEVCTQFSDVRAALELRFQIDLADIQIAHGYYHRGDTTFEYLLRENEIKDYIYYRYAHAYVDIDIEKAKWIAQRAFAVVDKRYVYYPLLVEIANR